jgi:hypothetical protein
VEHKGHKMIISENTKVTINMFMLISIVISIISFAFVFGRRFEKYESRMVAVEKSYSEHSEIRSEVERTQETLASQEIALAEIRTDLKWIRAKLEKDYR